MSFVQMPELSIASFSLATGLLALLLSIAGFQAKERNGVLVVLCASNLFWCMHFYLIGALTGSAMNAVSMTRNYIYLRHRNLYSDFRFPIIFVAIFLFATTLTWQGSLSLLPLGGSVTGTIASWQRNPKSIRLLSLLAPPMWFSYNFIQGSYPGMIIEIFVFCSISVAILRYDIFGQSEPVSQK